MNDSNTAGLIAIDGGGTNCRICLMLNGNRTEVRTGSANVSTDLEGSIRTIRQGLEAVATKAGITMKEFSEFQAYVGLAGVISPAMAKLIKTSLPLANATVEDDRSSAVVGALGADDGSVAGIGTGSFLARQDKGVIRFVGGHGPQLGDEASGASLGQALLASVLLVSDGLQTGTEFTDRIFAEFDGDTTRIVEFGQSATPQNFARYAPQIVEAAQAGDSVCLALMRAGAIYIERGIKSLGWIGKETLCLVGGVAPHYQSYLPPLMAAAVKPPKSNALDGALVLAGRINSLS